MCKKPYVEDNPRDRASDRYFLSAVNSLAKLILTKCAIDAWNLFSTSFFFSVRNSIFVFYMDCSLEIN